MIFWFDDRRVLPTVKPGYIAEMIPDEAPEEGEPWQDIFKDVERVIMPGVSPHSIYFTECSNLFDKW